VVPSSWQHHGPITLASDTWNLDDRELVQEVMKIQRQLDEPALIGPDGISADLHLSESDFTRFPPGEHVEEAAELSSVRGSRAIEDVHSPWRPAGLGDRLDGWGGNHSDRNSAE
jgi:hypothetical protein